MVVATEIFFALIVALAISIVAGYFLRREGPRTGFFIFYTSIFLFTLAGGLWLTPLGPPLSGVYWLPFIVVGSFGAYILYLKAPRKPPENREETLEILNSIEKKKTLEVLAYLTFDLFFWIILIIMLAIIIFRYFKLYTG